VRRYTVLCLQLDSPVVPNPFYGGEDGFEQVLDLAEDASEGLLRHVRAQFTRTSFGGQLRSLDSTGYRCLLG
jgi:hypothetical protein